MPILCTVRNTGSNFALKILEQHYVRHTMHEDLQGDPIWFSHTESDKMGIIRERITSHPPLILTMRHPMRVAESWIKRGKGMDHWFRQMWHNLFTLKESVQDSFWLPIDTDDREERLQVISERLGKDLQTDWMPVCSTGNNHAFRGGMTLDDCRIFFRLLPFEEFYGDVSESP